MKSRIIAAAMAASLAVITIASFARHSAQPANPDFDRLLGTQSQGSALQPTAPPAIDLSTGKAAVDPAAPQMKLQREGTFIVDRLGRLIQSGDQTGWEFAFESDGTTLADPPLRVLPNLKLMAMEDALQSTQRELRFRVTGMLTEYRGRNYILLERVVVVPENDRPF